MEAMDGPINFGERDKFWGLLIEGFIEPLYGMNYNFPITKNFLKTMGSKSILNNFVLPDRYLQKFRAFSPLPMRRTEEIQLSLPNP